MEQCLGFSSRLSRSPTCSSEDVLYKSDSTASRRQIIQIRSKEYCFVTQPWQPLTTHTQIPKGWCILYTLRATTIMLAGPHAWKTALLNISSARVASGQSCTHPYRFCLASRQFTAGRCYNDCIDVPSWMDTRAWWSMVPTGLTSRTGCFTIRNEMEALHTQAKFFGHCQRNGRL